MVVGFSLGSACTGGEKHLACSPYFHSGNVRCFNKLLWSNKSEGMGYNGKPKSFGMRFFTFFLKRWPTTRCRRKFAVATVFHVHSPQRLRIAVLLFTPRCATAGTSTPANDRPSGNSGSSSTSISATTRTSTRRLIKMGTELPMGTSSTHTHTYRIAHPHIQWRSTTFCDTIVRDFTANTTTNTFLLRAFGCQNSVFCNKQPEVDNEGNNTWQFEDGNVLFI